MLDIKFIRENIELVKEALRKRGYSSSLLSPFLEKEARRREIIQSLDLARKNRNEIQERINKGEKELISQTKALSLKIKELEGSLREIEASLDEILYLIPNIPHSSVPFGKDPSGNKEIRRHGEIKTFPFTPKPHYKIGEALGILDPTRSSKLSGSRFSLYIGRGALLERALINFMLDLHTKEHGYCEVLPPFLVNSKAMRGTGQLPKFSEDLFRCKDCDLWLIPTGEVPITNIHADEIIPEEKLPISYVGYTPCFRKEAGSYGKETKGLIRQHQFNKVELVRITRQEDSYNELEILTSHAEEVLKRLELPYRVVVLCSGDLGFSASKTYDIEVWMPGMNKFLEVSSCSNFEDFQARRANIKYRKDGKGCFVHTLNGSGLAVGRTFAAILENYQQSNGCVSIPHVLREYIKGEIL